MIQLDLTDQGITHIHFIGIGGISMSAIAELLLNFGYTISGSDMRASKITDKLCSKGVTIHIGHSSDNIPACDLVVYTAAIKNDNPELKRARELGIPVIDRAEMLGLLMKKFSNSIAISGTHGKTTTTSMVSLILEHSGFQPTILVGGELDEIGGNIKIGESNYLVTEACEYVESFLKFFPTLGVILNIEADHLDYFRDLSHIIEAFTKFARLIPKEGHLVVFKDDPNIRSLLSDFDCNVITCGIKEEGDYTARNIGYNHLGFPFFDVYFHNKPLGHFQLNVPGYHNICNALAAIAATHTLGASIEKIQERLSLFRGTHRRFDILGVVGERTIVDDYAHHPTEIQATLQAAANYPHNKIWCVFQSHTYTRTKSLLKDFAVSFTGADKVIVADIYAAREKDTGEIHAQDLVKSIGEHHHDVSYIGGFSDIVDYLSLHTHPGDLILTMGAGDIYKVGEMLLDAMTLKTG
ncbi:UDP-N-acetylmuramate--alanine ligase [Anaerosolibacter carboniphilus]|uniref:UDP-N-acetylmuramate--L-alanine ligase n=1 Tax=Anaerosolibacter carboniphilus TaxID=1417629 RepID=A0A841KYP0_9FIRM|nr:UDP-N-acetylmuramate--L-alanine ligase [Anaerosolibacter carboniphilus]MBB6218453.1 UDP-N-acetylmuramate--alanine ligase [Anaerosolibacter carboniphilus]